MIFIYIIVKQKVFSEKILIKKGAKIFFQYQILRLTLKDSFSNLGFDCVFLMFLPFV